jgi:hypothetical protein
MDADQIKDRTATSWRRVDRRYDFFIGLKEQFWEIGARIVSDPRDTCRCTSHPFHHDELLKFAVNAGSA